jgi:hypothetical protein
MTRIQVITILISITLLSLVGMSVVIGLALSKNAVCEKLVCPVDEYSTVGKGGQCVCIDTRHKPTAP